jgi:hypothetical protein
MSNAVLSLKKASAGCGAKAGQKPRRLSYKPHPFGLR